jgi:hypothetical protein
VGGSWEQFEMIYSIVSDERYLDRTMPNNEYNSTVFMECDYMFFVKVE